MRGVNMNIEHECFYETEADYHFKGWNTIFNEQFISIYTLFMNRIEKFKTLDIDSLDYITYRDILLCTIRAILFENHRYSNNYTLRNFLIKNERNDLVECVDEFCDQQINKEFSFKEGIKNSVDKFIAHRDTLAIKNETTDDFEFDSDAFAKNGLYMSDLKRGVEYHFSIENIAVFIKKIIDESSLIVD